MVRKSRNSWSQHSETLLSVLWRQSVENAVYADSGLSRESREGAPETSPISSFGSSSSRSHQWCSSTHSDIWFNSRDVCHSGKASCMHNMSLLLQVYTAAILNRVLNWNHKSGSINRIRIFGEYSTNLGTRVRFDSNSIRANSNFSFRIRIRIRRIIHSFSKFEFAEYSRIRIRIRIGRILPHPCSRAGFWVSIGPVSRMDIWKSVF
jgi:hypothetical protein